ncbi:MAG: hypothetical protein PHP11_05670 [Erysipelotrichaceae bacterium]|nr:hypothetical protein [Erysipelotrichaceae bacterium]
MLKIVCSTVDITPTNPVYLRGHAMRKDKSKGVHDKLEAVICWLMVDNTLNLFINGDVSNWDYAFVHEFKESINKQFGVALNHIVLSATHTHSGPVLSTVDKELPHDENYRQDVMKKLIDGATSIYGKEQLVKKVVYSNGLSNGFYGNRNGKDKYGDQNIYVLEFKNDNNENIAAFVNLSCHSTVLSPTEYQLSGDLLGAIRRKLTPLLGVVPMMMNGNAGDMSNRLYRKNNDFVELDRVSSGIAHQIMGFAHKEELILKEQKSKNFTFEVSYDTDKETLQSKLIEFSAKLDNVEEFDARKWLISEIAGFKRKLAVDHVDLKLETTIIRMNDLELVIVPCEMVSTFGKQIKKTSSAKVCIVWGYANGQTTYVVEASEFNGGHDGIATNLPKGKAEEYIALILQNLID